MAYDFNFDLSKLSRSFFKDIARFSHEKNVHKIIGKRSRQLVKKFNIDKLVGVRVSDAMKIVEDIIDNEITNLSTREEFEKTKKRALLLPHCSRKYMDSRCKAKFDADTSSYICSGCSKDCLVNIATGKARKKGYDVYVLPGGSCIRKIIKKRYSGIVGVACCEEIKLARDLLEGTNMMVQGVPLIKNGCAYTKFEMETLEKFL